MIYTNFFLKGYIINELLKCAIKKGEVEKRMYLKAPI
jgi:hypothetical protein